MFFKTDLENYTKGCSDIDSFIDAFEKMCSHRNSVIDDFIFLDSGNYDYSGKNEYYFSLVRQYRDNVFSEAETQTRLDIIFEEQPISLKNRRTLKKFISSDQYHGSFSRCIAKIRSSSTLANIKQNKLKIKRVEISEHEV